MMKKFSKLTKRVMLIFIYFNTLLAHGYPSAADLKEPGVCSTAQFECHSGDICIPDAWACDGELDCPDNSDELNCSPDKIAACGPEEFRCVSGQCIPLDWQCDGEMDCPDGLDEWDNICNKSGSDKCKEEEFRCHADGSCIPADWRCDGIVDCVRDAADEEDCKVNCTAGEFRCRSDGKCIQDRWICDGVADCKDGSDEVNCTHEVVVNNCDEEKEFSCKDTGHCLDGKWWCDGERDCTDGSDEMDCKVFKNDTVGNMTQCGDDTWTCDDNVQCINTDWRCDGDRDCEDGSDEVVTNCADLVTKNKTELSECDLDTQFDCGHGRGCIPLERMCDHHNDCGGWEDEPSSCHHGQDMCEDNNGGCDQVCVNTEASHRCTCWPGYKLVTNSTCEDVDECLESSDTCSQQCTNTNGSYTCSCYPGYTLHPQNSSLCVVQSGKVGIMFTNGTDLSLVDTESRHVSRVLSLTSAPSHVASHLAANLIFWVDGRKKSILRSNLFADIDNSKVVIDEDVSADDKIGLDWVHSHLYWISLKRNAIMVTSLSGDKMAKIVNISDADHPLAIAVSPESGLLFWSETRGNETRGRILRSNLAGDGVETIVDDSNYVITPEDIAVDNVKRKVFWLDTKLNHVGVVNFDGGDPNIVISLYNQLHNPKSLSVFEDWLYLSNSSHIYKTLKNGGQKLEHILEIKHIGSVRASHPLVQPPSTNQCQRRSRKCSFMCVPTSQNSSQCLCPSGSVLDHDKSSCFIKNNKKNAISSQRKNVNIDKHIKEMKRADEKDNFIIVLLVGTIAGSLLLILVISIIVLKCKRANSRDSQDTLDSYEKPPLLNRNLYEAPRKRTFSKCLPDSESMVPLNGEGSSMSSNSSSNDNSENNSDDIVVDTSENDCESV